MPVLVSQLEVCYEVDRLVTGLTVQLLYGIQIEHLHCDVMSLLICP